METLVEWKELCDGEAGKVGPCHLNHLEGGGRCVLGREGGGVCWEGREEDMHHAEIKVQMTPLPHKVSPMTPSLEALYMQ